MSEEITNEAVENTEDQTPEVVEDKVDGSIDNTISEASGAEDKQSIIGKLWDKVSGVASEPGTAKEDSNELSAIPDTFTDAALSSGWTEEQIIKLAEGHTNEELEKLIPFILEEGEEKAEQSDLPDDTKEEEASAAVDLPGDVDEKLKPHLEEIRKFYETKNQEQATRLEALEAALALRDQERADKEVLNRAQTADAFFDRVSKDFPVFGKTKELVRFPDGTPKAGQVMPTGAAFKARDAVWQMANKFTELGSDWNSALDEAMAWYKGKYGEKEIAGRLVRKLKQNETRLSAKRTSKHTTKTFANPHEEKQRLIEEIARKAGIS